MSSYKVKAQALHKGDFVVDVFYGGPNLWSGILTSFYTNFNTIDIGLHVIGPIGARGEYMLTDQIGLGLDLIYASNSIAWSEEDFFTPGGYLNYKLSVTRMRITPRLNYHFSTYDDFDFYAVAGAGYKHTQYVFDIDDPYYNGQNATAILPVSIRLAIGARYFITEKAGIAAEIGIGSALATFGATFKF